MTTKEIKQLTKVMNELKGSMPTSSRQRSKRKRVGRARRGGAGGMPRVPRGVNASTTITVPAAGSTIVRRGNLVPKIKTSENSTFVCNTELINNGDLGTTAAFAATTLPLIPSNFGWLVGLGNLFSKWRWHYLRVIYIPTCPSSTTGKVNMGFLYDAADIAYANFFQAQVAYEAITFPCWAGYEGSNLLNHFGLTPGPGAVVSTLDCDRLGGPNGDSFYRTITLASFNLQSNVDKNIFCPALLNVVQTGGPAVSVNMGSLMVEYCIELVEPIASGINF